MLRSTRWQRTGDARLLTPARRDRKQRVVASEHEACQPHGTTADPPHTTPHQAVHETKRTPPHTVQQERVRAFKHTAGEQGESGEGSCGDTRTHTRIARHTHSHSHSHTQPQPHTATHTATHLAPLHAIRMPQNAIPAQTVCCSRLEDESHTSSEPSLVPAGRYAYNIVANARTCSLRDAGHAPSAPSSRLHGAANTSNRRKARTRGQSRPRR